MPPNITIAPYTLAPALLAILWVSLSIPVALAQQPASPFEAVQGISPSPAPGEKLYLTEVIVFNNLVASSSGGEMWHREPRIEFDPSRLQRRPAGAVPVPKPIEPASETVEPVPFRYTELVHLAPFLSMLRADSRYEVVAYTAWVQPLFGKRDAVAVSIKRSATASESVSSAYAGTRGALSGTVQIFENQLLFVDVDVISEYFVGLYGASAAAPPARPPGKYSLREKRRVKLNELHYFDHPFFGLLFRVSRYDPEATAD
jgi:hypothetical protein